MITLLAFRSDNPEEDSTIHSILENLQEFMSVRMIDMGDQEFSRGQALTAGSQALSDNALMFFTDVDMLFTFETVQRIRLNTIQNKQVS